jgi:hypothetical protein
MHASGRQVRALASTLAALTGFAVAADSLDTVTGDRARVIRGP